MPKNKLMLFARNRESAAPLRRISIWRGLRHGLIHRSRWPVPSEALVIGIPNRPPVPSEPLNETYLADETAWHNIADAGHAFVTSESAYACSPQWVPEATGG